MLFYYNNIIDLARVLRVESPSLSFGSSMHPRGGRGGRLGPPQQENQMDPQREKAMRSIFGNDHNHYVR